jgi:hypothetical protein
MKQTLFELLAEYQKSHVNFKLTEEFFKCVDRNTSTKVDVSVD